MDRPPIPDEREDIAKQRHEFASRLQRGEWPDLRACLNQVPIQVRSTLFAELLELELEAKARDGQPLRFEEYVSRFPDYSDRVEAAFPAAAAKAGQETVDGDTTTGPGGYPIVEGFEIEKTLGRGGMGIVYLARQPALNRLVALKMLRSGEAKSASQLIRFQVEGEMLARLEHPNIVRVYQTGEDNGRPYLAMEYVPGGTLERSLRDGPLPPEQAAELAETLARAVEYAHRNGVIHRDLKPANVLIGEDHRPRIVDFGLALTEGQDVRMTASGMMVGTPAYMAPEQAAGKRQLGPGVDIYALGAILYELLCGRPPFIADSVMELARMVMQDEPTPPTKHRPGLPADLGTIALKCLAKEPEQRYATAAELADDVGRWRSGEPIFARPASRIERAVKWCKRRPAQATAAALSVLVLVVAVTAAFLLRNERNALVREQLQRQAAETERMRERVAALLTASPDRVPGLLDDLAPDKAAAIPLLREASGSSDPLRTLRAVIGLAVLGEPQDRLLLEYSRTAPAAESRNLAMAFRGTDAATRAELKAHAVQGGHRRVRDAALMLSFGDASATAMLLEAGIDPTLRTIFIDEFPAWHGELTAIAEVIRAASPQTRSGLCAAVGGIEPDTLPAGTRESLVELFQSLYRNDPDPGTHSAAAWALRRWNVSLPVLPPEAAAPAGRGWFINQSGLTMLRLTPGAYTRENGTVVLLTDPVYLSDCEVPQSLLDEFLAANGGSRPKTADTHDKPAVNMPRRQMLAFCNWLSERERRTPCYKPAESPDGFDWDRTADGYRLPSEGEWEYAARAGTTTRFFFANDSRWLPDYANIAASGPTTRGSRRPNRWGFFDMIGNAWEMVADGNGPLPNSSAANPIGPTGTNVFVTRGGSYDSGSYDTWSGARHAQGLDPRTGTTFRVALGAPGSQGQSEPELLAAAIKTAGPLSPAAHRIAGDMLAKQRDWPAASKHMVEAFHIEPRVWEGYLAASLALQAGDAAAYERVRRQFLAMQPSLDKSSWEVISKACLLAPPDAEQMKVLAITTDAAIAEGQPPAYRAYFALTRGLFEYRIGRWNDSLKWLDRAAEPKLLNAPSQAMLSFTKALALHRLRDSTAARKELAAAETLIGEDDRAWQAGNLPGAWYDQLAAQAMAREARRVIDTGK